MHHERTRTNRLAAVVLMITVILLLFSRFTSSWDLHLSPLPLSSHLVPQPEDGTTNIPKTLSKNYMVYCKPKKAAVMLETQPLPALIPLVLPFSTLLGPDWPIYIYTSESNAVTFKKSLLPRGC